MDKGAFRLGLVISAMLGVFWLFSSSSKLNSRHVMEGLVGLGSTTKIMVMEYYLERGQYPEDNASLQLPEPMVHRGNFLTHVEIVKGSIVMTQLNDQQEVLGRVLLMPRAAGNMGQVHFDCSSDTYKDIDKVIATCEYNPYRQPG